MTRHDKADDGRAEPQFSLSSHSQRPYFLDVPILARIDPKGPFSEGNVHWRIAVSQEEAGLGTEIHCGSDLRDRFLALERKGWVSLTEEGRRQLDNFSDGNGIHGESTPKHGGCDHDSE